MNFSADLAREVRRWKLGPGRGGPAAGRPGGSRAGGRRRAGGWGALAGGAGGPDRPGGAPAGVPARRLAVRLGMPQGVKVRGAGTVMSIVEFRPRTAHYQVVNPGRPGRWGHTMTSGRWLMPPVGMLLTMLVAGAAEPAVPPELAPF